MTEGHKGHIQQQKTRRVVDRAVGGQLVLLRRARRSVLLVAVVLAHLHQTLVVDRVLVHVARVVHGARQLGGVESRNRQRKTEGYVHFTDMLLLVLGHVLWVNARERSYGLRSHEHVVVLRVRH